MIDAGDVQQRELQRVRGMLEKLCGVPLLETPAERPGRNDALLFAPVMAELRHSRRRSADERLAELRALHQEAAETLSSSQVRLCMPFNQCFCLAAENQQLACSERRSIAVFTLPVT